MTRLLEVGLILALVFNAPVACGQILLIEEQPRIAGRLPGIVVDASEAPLDYVDVVELSDDGKSELGITATDAKGAFHLNSSKRGAKHLLEFRKIGFNPLRVLVVVKGGNKQTLRIQMQVAA